MSTTDTMDHSLTGSVSYHEDDDDVAMQAILDDMKRFQFTGMERLYSDSTDDESWDAESYAVDSMELAKHRLPHVSCHDDDEDMTSSIGQGSAAGRYVFDEDDWTVKSDCNDSVGLARDRLEHDHEQHDHEQYNQARPALARITRRRPRDVAKTQRRMSMSSVLTNEESLYSQGSGNSDDPAGSRPAVVRRKSMPAGKTTPLSKVVALWPEEEKTTRRKMQRRVSNSGTPCAA